jgi:hypothetical protein
VRGSAANRALTSHCGIFSRPLNSRSGHAWNQPAVPDRKDAKNEKTEKHDPGQELTWEVSCVRNG